MVTKCVLYSIQLAAYMVTNSWHIVGAQYYSYGHKQLSHSIIIGSIYGHEQQANSRQIVGKQQANSRHNFASGFSGLSLISQSIYGLKIVCDMYTHGRHNGRHMEGTMAGTMAGTWQAIIYDNKAHYVIQVTQFYNNSITNQNNL